MPLDRKRLRKQADQSVNFRINGELWEQFKALCDGEGEAKIPYSEALTEYIEFAVNNQILTARDDKPDYLDQTPGKDSHPVSDKLTQVMAKIQTLEFEISELKKGADYIERNKDTVPDVKLVTVPDAKPIAILGTLPNPLQDEDQAEKKPEFNLADDLTMPDPLAVDPDVTNSGDNGGVGDVNGDDGGILHKESLECVSEVLSSPSGNSPDDYPLMTAKELAKYFPFQCLVFDHGWGYGYDTIRTKWDKMGGLKKVGNYDPHKFKVYPDEMVINKNPRNLTDPRQK